jgi:excisionase family DNA binding protein
MAEHHSSELNTRARTALLSINDVAGYLRVTRATVYKLVADGELQSVRVGQRFRFRPGDVDAYLERDEAAP